MFNFLAKLFLKTPNLRYRSIFPNIISKIQIKTADNTLMHSPLYNQLYVYEKSLNHYIVLIISSNNEFSFQQSVLIQLNMYSSKSNQKPTEMKGNR